MKRTFSLIELVFSVVILGVLFILLSSPVVQIYQYSFKSKKTNGIFFDLNQALLSIEKIYQSCVDLKYTNNSFECYLSANDDIFYDTSLKKLNFSGIILENDKMFFSPKSNFYTIENGISKGIFSNYKDMHSIKKQKIYPSDFLYIYSLKESKIYKFKINNEDKVSFIDEKKFTGLYSVIYAYVKIYFKNGSIFIQIDDLNYHKNDFLLIKDVSRFEIAKENEILSVKLCEENQKECLTKWIFI
ncbi:type II secretion system protein [Campylobacter sp. RM16704]|uniref:type II secretion system protein n=1 Tax=Campylobacter sp. RM16704 TaxID=1500960 RepID=UPI00057EE8C1|nr:hypothetical protein [Campylobacter sp. RM16704]AJC86402.1 hypothetical protein CAQ16704_0945 [Campylobacter sp. RM16704]